MNELTTIDPNQGVTSYQDALGLSESDALKIYNLKLVQPISAGPGIVAGKFLDAQMGTQVDKLSIVLLTIQPGRSLMPPREAGFDNVRPICKSYDGKFPVVSPDVVRQDGGRGCKLCPKGQSSTINGKWIRPECDQTFLLTFMDADTQFVYRILAKGTGIPPVKSLQDTLDRFRKLANAKKQPFAHFAYVIELSSVYHTTKTGNKYYSMTFGLPKPIQDKDLFTEAQATFEKLISRRYKDADEVADPVDQAIDNATAPFDIQA